MHTKMTFSGTGRKREFFLGAEKFSVHPPWFRQTTWVRSQGTHSSAPFEWPEPCPTTWNHLTGEISVHQSKYGVGIHPAWKTKRKNRSFPIEQRRRTWSTAEVAQASPEWNQNQTAWNCRELRWKLHSPKCRNSEYVSRSSRLCSDNNATTTVADRGTQWPCRATLRGLRSSLWNDGGIMQM